MNRDIIIGALTEALAHTEGILALCEGGAAAFGRVDEWSDIDLTCIVRDDAVGAAFTAAEQALAELSRIETAYTIPQPTWHGHAQKFYKLEKAGPFRLIDYTVIRESAQNKFLEPEIHGRVIVHFDKAAIAGSTVSPDRDAFASMLAGRVASLRSTFPLFQCLPLKEAHRGNAVEALAFYHAFTLAPLVELLRIRHAPFHYNFRTRYLHYDLPEGVVAQVQQLYFVTDLDDLLRKQRQAEEWFAELADWITDTEIADGVRAYTV